MAKKNYRVIGTFYYHGPDGKRTKGTVVSPGEPIPKLEDSELNRLLHAEKICEVSMDGENVRYDKLKALDKDQIDNLIRKGPKFVVQEIVRTKYANDTLAEIYKKAEEVKFPEGILAEIEAKIG